MFIDETSLEDDVHVQTSDVDGIAVVEVSGQLDFATCPAVVEHVNFALAADPAAFVVDFSEVGLMSSSGLALLVRIRRAASPDMQLAVVANGSTRRSIEVTGLNQIVELHWTLSDALASFEDSRDLGETG